MARRFSGGDGRAALCFPSDDSAWFQGYFFGADGGSQLGLMGEELPVDACVECPDGGYQEFRVTVMHFKMAKETTVVVLKTGGDLCSLDSEELTFQPSLLLTDAKAVEAVRTYFPTIAERAGHNSDLLLDCTVCFGDMHIAALDFT